MSLEADDKTARLRADFPSALRGGQLVPYFQPKAELSSGLVVGVEALARWEHPDLGTLPPALFTPLAEQLGLTAEFTSHMLRLSLAQHRTWAGAGWVIPIAVNVGPDCVIDLSLIHISEPTRLGMISYAVFCLKKKKKKK